MKNFVCFLIGILFFGFLNGCTEAPETPQTNKQQVSQTVPIAQVESRAPSSPEEASDLGDFSDVMNSLVESMDLWSELAYPQKLIAVQSMIQVLETQDGAKISQPAEYYVARVDSMISESPGFPYGLPAMIRFLAVMDYDFQNGQDPDALAKEVLGEELYEANKQRLETMRQAAGA